MNISTGKQLYLQWAKLMAFLLISWFISHPAISQDDVNNSKKVKKSALPSRMQIEQVNAGLRARAMFIQLRAHPRLVLDDDQYKAFSSVHDSLLLRPNVVPIDSTSITLHSGISWNLNGNPPTLPKKSLLKLFTKKGRADRTVSDYLKFQDFCNTWTERNELPYEMVEKFNHYYAIKDGDDILLKMAFELKFDEGNRMRITEKEIHY